MAFSGQVFSVGQVLTAAQMNQQDENIDEVRRSHKGSTQPPELTAGLLWIDDTAANLWKLKVYSGTSFIDMGNVDTSAGLFRAAVMGQFKNKIINGNFDLWQRGTSFTSTGGILTADRWVVRSSDGTRTVSRQSFTLGQTDVPGEPRFFLRHDRTVAATLADSVIEQRIEDVRTFAGQAIVLTFYAKVASGTKILTPRFVQNFGSGGSPSSEVVTAASNITVTTAWQKFTVTATIPSITGKTIGTNENSYLRIDLLEAGTLSTFTLDFAQFQIEAGSIATEFEKRHIGQELLLAQRYFYILKGTNDGDFFGSGLILSSTQASFYGSFPVEMRAAPTFTSAGLHRVQATTSFIASGVAAPNLTTKSYRIDLTISGATAGHGATYRLDTSSDSSSFSAEL